MLSQYSDPVYVLMLLESGSDGPRVPAQGARPRPRGSWSRRSRRSPRGESVIDPKIVEVLVASKARSERSPLAELTPRELEVLAAIAEGKSNTRDLRRRSS